MNEINLVSGKNVELEKQVKTLKILRIIALCSLLSVGLISIIFFIITLLLPIASVKKDQDQTRIGISQFHKRIVTVVLAQERIKNINILLTKRKDYPQITAEIMNPMPSDLTVNVLTIDQGTLVVTVSGPSLLSINGFIDNLITIADKNNKFANLTIQNLTFNPSSSIYSLTFQADIQ